MNLNDLKNAGAFVGAGLTKVSISWERGPEDTLSFEVHVAPLSFGEVERILREESEGKSRVANLISSAIRLGETGQERLTYMDAYNLEPGLAKAFAKAVGEANELGKAKAPS